MSGIAGIYNLDGRPVDPALLKRMTDAIAYRGPDGINYWINGPVGLGHCMLHTTPESLHEKQPVIDETGQLCLTLDGRVDNRDELKASLEAKGARLRDDTDAELVLKAYEVWGEKSPEKILGDFAYVIWDGRRRLLFCARDIFGFKPFYYHFDGSTFRWGSELPVIFVDPAVRREPNEGMIAEYLAWSITSQEETLYQDVFRLPPAHALVVQSGQLRKGRYWNIDPTKQIRYRTDEEYTEHFFEIFKEAVRCRLRSHGLAGAHLSGGVDSSSVVSMAQWLFREGIVADRGFETFSLVFPGLPCDESTYINDVVDKWRLRSNTTEPAKLDASYYEEQVRRYQDFPDAPNGGALHHSQMIQAQQKGFRVLLTGGGGDDWLTGSQRHHADLLRSLKIIPMVKQARWDRKVFAALGGTPPSYWSLLGRNGLWPLLPSAAQRIVKWMLKKDQSRAPAWMAPQFVSRIRLSEPLRKTQAADLQFFSFAQKHLASFLTSGWSCVGKEICERCESWFGLECRHPFYDRRIVEFALALPEEQRWRQDQTKFVLRQAMQGLLPETVRQRRTKADFTHLDPEALQVQGGERLYEDLAIASVGWVDREMILLRYRKMVQLYAQDDDQYFSYTGSMWMIRGIDLWFRTTFLNNAADLPQAGLNQNPSSNVVTGERIYGTAK